MSGKQLCPASSKGMKERSSGSAAASGRSGVRSPRATRGLIQLPFSPGEDPPGLPAPEARRPPLSEHRVPPGSRALAAAGLPSRRCGGGSPPVPTLQLLAASRFPWVPRLGRSDPLCRQSAYRPRPEQEPKLYKHHNSPPKPQVFPQGTAQWGGTSGSCACGSRAWPASSRSSPFWWLSSCRL